MKKRLLQFGSLLIALVVLFVTIGWDVCFHYCTMNQTLTSHIGINTSVHAKCSGHDECTEETHENHQAVHFDKKSCCDDFDNKIQFTDSFTFSSLKQQITHFQPITLVHLDMQRLVSELNQVNDGFKIWKIPFLPKGKAWLFFISNLKLNPLVL